MVACKPEGNALFTMAAIEANSNGFVVLLDELQPPKPIIIKGNESTNEYRFMKFISFYLFFFNIKEILQFKFRILYINAEWNYSY